MPTVIPFRRIVFCLLLAAACTPVIILIWQTMKTAVGLYLNPGILLFDSIACT